MIDQAIEKQSAEKFIELQGRFPSETQKALGLDVMKLLQFDFEHGRLDESVHPFCGGVPSDVRITTRYDEQEFVQSLMGIVHETGHARYEQGLPKSLAGLPSGEGRSMGIHESQSLFFEMQVGRHDAFIAHLARLAGQHFTGHDANLFSQNNFQKLYTRVKKDFIRVDADELTYPAHVILRYEIERDLINGQIKHTDIPELWDLKCKATWVCRPKTTTKWLHAGYSLDRWRVWLLPELHIGRDVCGAIYGFDETKRRCGFSDSIW